MKIREPLQKFTAHERDPASPPPPPPLGPPAVIEVEVLWPPTLSLAGEAPSRVRELYEEARKVRKVRKHSPSSFVVLIGRAMEAVANDKQAQGKTLYQKLEWLINSNQLPDILGKMGQLNRITRNWEHMMRRSTSTLTMPK